MRVYKIDEVFAWEADNSLIGGCYTHIGEEFAASSDEEALLIAERFQEEDDASSRTIIDALTDTRAAHAAENAYNAAPCYKSMVMKKNGEGDFEPVDY